jgi:hypothetical protein
VLAVSEEIANDGEHMKVAQGVFEIVTLLRAHSNLLVDRSLGRPYEYAVLFLSFFVLLNLYNQLN